MSPESSESPQVRRWHTLDVMRVAALILAIWYLLRLLWVAQTLVFVVFLGVLFGLAVGAGAERLTRWRIPRGVGAPLIVVVFVGLIVLFGVSSAPLIRRQSHELRTKLPGAVTKLEVWLDKKTNGIGAIFTGDSTAAPADSVRAPAALPQDSIGAAIDTATKAKADTLAKPLAARDSTPASRTGGIMSSAMANAQHYMVRVVSRTLTAIGGTILVLVLAIYVGADPGVYRRGMLHLFPHRARPRAEEVMHALGETLRKWLVTQLIAMLVIGVVTTIVLLVLHVKAALPLGLLAGLLEFIPTIGPVLSAVPSVAMAFVDSPQKALAVVIAYWGIQFLENHILIPLLMRRGLDLPPVLTLVAQAVMALVFGFMGLLIAVPLVAAGMVMVRMLYVEDVVGDPVEGDQPVRP